MSTEPMAGTGKAARIREPMPACGWMLKEAVGGNNHPWRMPTVVALIVPAPQRSLKSSWAPGVYRSTLASQFRRKTYQYRISLRSSLANENKYS